MKEDESEDEYAQQDPERLLARLSKQSRWILRCLRAQEDPVFAECGDIDCECIPRSC